MTVDLILAKTLAKTGKGHPDFFLVYYLLSYLKSKKWN